MTHINIPQSEMHVCHIPTSHYERHMSVKYSNPERSTSIIVFSGHREKKKPCIFATCGKHLHNRIIWGGFGPIKLIQLHHKYVYQDKKERVMYLSTYMYQDKKERERVMYLSTYMYQDKKEIVMYLSTRSIDLRWYHTLQVKFDPL